MDCVCPGAGFMYILGLVTSCSPYQPFVVVLFFKIFLYVEL